MCPTPSGYQSPDDGTGVGYVNAHTHIYSALVPLMTRGLLANGLPTDPANFKENLERLWWQLDRALDESTLQASAELYVAEAQYGQTAALIDHHESPNFIEGSLDVLHDACAHMGMYALLCYGITERNGGAQEAARGLAENRRFLERDKSEFVRGAVGLHASFTLSDESIRAAGELAAEFSAPLHIHVAEDPLDVEDAQQRGYEGVIDRLDKLGALQENAILAHGVHLTREEVELASERGVWFVQNPKSNRGNGVGYPRHLAAAAKAALGTDGWSSLMFGEHAVLMEDAAQAEAAGAIGELSSAARRLITSGALGLQLFPALAKSPATPLRPSADQLTTIQDNAQRAADRLWARMEEMREAPRNKKSL